MCKSNIFVRIQSLDMLSCNKSMKEHFLCYRQNMKAFI